MCGWMGGVTDCGARRLRGGTHTVTHSHRHAVTHHLALRVTGWIRPPSGVSFSDTFSHTHLRAGSEGH